MSGKPRYSGATIYSEETTTQSKRTSNTISTTIKLSFCRYNKLSGMVKSLAGKIKELDPKDPYRNDVTTQLLEKL